MSKLLAPQLVPFSVPVSPGREREKRQRVRLTQLIYGDLIGQWLLQPRFSRLGISFFPVYRDNTPYSCNLPFYTVKHDIISPSPTVAN